MNDSVVKQMADKFRELASIYDEIDVLGDDPDQHLMNAIVGKIIFIQSEIKVLSR